MKLPPQQLSAGPSGPIKNGPLKINAEVPPHLPFLIHSLPPIVPKNEWNTPILWIIPYAGPFVHDKHYQSKNSVNFFQKKYWFFLFSMVSSLLLEKAMGEFPSGQGGQTVNLLALPSVVRIHLRPFTYLLRTTVLARMCSVFSNIYV